MSQATNEQVENASPKVLHAVVVVAVVVHVGAVLSFQV